MKTGQYMRPDSVGQAYWDKLPPDEQRALYDYEVKREAEMAQWEVVYAERRKARLIERAAPDLLAALEDMLNLTLNEDDIAVWMRVLNARAAIAKAKGEGA